ncbi:hypothetical protein K1T71_001570 [Dendrolimus kikuchii]|uniref:Uncharacterized protein n=1 Tax=Dendrolimus kikuchii TaxID=765133 RepID=A0ACC1DEB2_9NEOP|nr:hypothetical protein K1T71_001570 [Dendrolimus kikuchii]
MGDRIFSEAVRGAILYPVIGHSSYSILIVILLKGHLGAKSAADFNRTGPFSAAQYRSDVHAAVYRCRAASTVGSILSRDMRLEAETVLISKCLKTSAELIPNTSQQIPAAGKIPGSLNPVMSRRKTLGMMVGGAANCLRCERLHLYSSDASQFPFSSLSHVLALGIPAPWAPFGRWIQYKQPGHVATCFSIQQRQRCKKDRRLHESFSGRNQILSKGLAGSRAGNKPALCAAKRSVNGIRPVRDLRDYAAESPYLSGVRRVAVSADLPLESRSKALS